MRPSPDLEHRLSDLRTRCGVWLQYLQHNVDIRNWHGVEDAASDLRDFEAEIRTLEWVLGQEPIWTFRGSVVL